MLYEDGEQTRDFSFVEDIARANWLAAEHDALDGLPVNVGSGKGVAVREVAEQISAASEYSRSRRRSTANFAPARCVT